jgi:hypothetical protein
MYDYVLGPTPSQESERSCMIMCFVLHQVRKVSDHVWLCARSYAKSEKWVIMHEYVLGPMPSEESEQSYMIMC